LGDLNVDAKITLLLILEAQVVKRIKLAHVSVTLRNFVNKIMNFRFPK